MVKIQIRVADLSRHKIEVSLSLLKQCAFIASEHWPWNNFIPHMTMFGLATYLHAWIQNKQHEDSQSYRLLASPSRKGLACVNYLLHACILTCLDPTLKHHREVAVVIVVLRNQCTHLQWKWGQFLWKDSCSVPVHSLLILSRLAW